MPVIPGTANLWQLTSKYVLFGKENQLWPWLGSVSPAPVTSLWKLGAASPSWDDGAERTWVPWWGIPTNYFCPHHPGSTLLRSASMATSGCLLSTISFSLGKGCSTWPRVSAEQTTLLSFRVWHRSLNPGVYGHKYHVGELGDSSGSRSQARSAQVRLVSLTALRAGLVFSLKKGRSYSEMTFGEARQPLHAMLFCSRWAGWQYVWLKQPGKNTYSLKTPVLRNIQCLCHPLKSK